VARAGLGDSMVRARARARARVRADKMVLERKHRVGEGAYEGQLETMGSRWQQQGGEIGERQQAGERVSDLPLKY